MDSIRTVWDGLDSETRDWLISHNGEAVEAAVLEVIPARWVAADGALVDEVVDWIEAVANGEDPDA